MKEVGIRTLERNASSVVAMAVSGEAVTITDRGRAVAQLVAMSASPWQRLQHAGRLRAPTRDLAELPEPSAGPDLGLATMRVTERY